MKLKVILYLLLMLLIANTTLRGALREEQLLRHSINLKISEIFKKKYELSFMGVCVGAPGGTIEYMGLLFEFEGSLSKQGCRKLIVTCAEEYLAAINGNQEIQKYLNSSPFSIKNIGIDIYFLKPDHDGVSLS